MKNTPAQRFPAIRNPYARSALSSVLILPAVLNATLATAEEENGDEIVEEIVVTGSYSANTVNLGKGFETVREIPQSITIITSQVMKDQNMLTLTDAMKVTTGVTVKSYGAGTTNYLMRGFELDSVSIDGVRTAGTSSGTHGHGSPDLISYEQVEVLRGPAGLLEGAGEPGGYINLVRKKAREERRLHLKGYADSWSGYRAELDATGALLSDGRLRGRAALGYEDTDSHIDEVEGRKNLFYSTLEYDVTDNFTIAGGATIEDVEIVPDVGVPAYADGTFADISRDLYTGAPFNFKESDLSRQFFEAKYRFDIGAAIVLTLNNTERDFEYLLNYTTSPIDPETGESLRWALATDQELSEQSFDLHTHIPFSLWGQSHKVLLGVNGYGSENHSSGYQIDFEYPPINVFDPASADNPDPTNTLTEYSAPSTDDTSETGFYFKSTLGLTDTTNLIVGGRLTSEWKTEADDGSPASEIENEFTPYAGIVQELSESLSVYFSVTESFVPQTERDANENILDPRTGCQYEAGLKGELNRKAASYHLAVFQITEDNRAIEDIEVPDASIEGGEVQAQGMEAEISGNVLDNLQVLAGYAYTDTELVETGNPEDDGKPFSSITPEHSLKLWGKYRYSERLAFGMGMEYGSGTFWESGGVRWEDDGYTILSLMSSYKFNDRTQIILTGTNLTDEEYYSRVQGGSRQNYFGDPRQFKVSLETSF